MRKVSLVEVNNYALLKTYIGHQILATLYTLSKKDVSSRSNCDDMRVFTEGFESDRIMVFA